MAGETNFVSRSVGSYYGRRVGEEEKTEIQVVSGETNLIFHIQGPRSKFLSGGAKEECVKENFFV